MQLLSLSLSVSLSPSLSERQEEEKSKEGESMEGGREIEWPGSRKLWKKSEMRIKEFIPGRWVFIVAGNVYLMLRGTADQNVYNVSRLWPMCLSFIEVEKRQQ